MRRIATMRTYPTLALLLCAVLSLGNGACYVKVHDADAAFCLDDVDNKTHPVGSSWINSDCMYCTCSSCCTTYSIPRRFPGYCVAVFNRSACEFKVFRRDDHSVECPFFSAVGK
ncbi:beta-microseminoprotein-like [Hippocampus comes]|uniref:beta-microseminoprotein-like n=1 Tax=Hippocampus comes TaxID=109280 RepID=UPI00094F0021|nr:PREDICTED: beta-microseminoprotein J1-like [Hippocampus comes]